MTVVAHPKDAALINADTANAEDLAVAYAEPIPAPASKGVPTQGRPLYVPSPRQTARARRGHQQVLKSYSRDLRFRLVAAVLRDRQADLRANPARLAAARTRQAEADARYQRRLDRRADSLGTVVAAPAGYGAKHGRHDAAVRAQFAEQEKVRQSAMHAPAAS